jgi:hypothetical protein
MFFREIFDSYALFYLRDSESEKIAKNRGIDINWLRNYRHSPDSFEFLQSDRPLLQESTSIPFDLQLQDFKLYATRLRYIQRKMEGWRPQTVRELAIRPYKDPLTYYGFWFAGFFGVASILLVFLAIAQTYAVFKMTALTT